MENDEQTIEAGLGTGHDLTSGERVEAVKETGRPVARHGLSLCICMCVCVSKSMKLLWAISFGAQ